MADFYTRKSPSVSVDEPRRQDVPSQRGPALSADIARVASTPQIDISRSLQLIDKFSAVASGRQATYIAMSQTAADRDFLKQTFNPTDARDEAVYVRTYRDRENRKLFEEVTAEMQAAFKDPSNEFSKMSDSDFNNWYKEFVSQRVEELAGDRTTANTQDDFVGFIAEHGPKLQANHSLLRKAVNQEKIVRETTASVADLFTTKGATVDKLNEQINKLPGIATMPKETVDNLLMSAAGLAAESGSKVGIDFAREYILRYNPDMFSKIDTLESVLIKKQIADNDKYIYTAKSEFDSKADNGLFGTEDEQRILNDPILAASISHKQALSWRRQSNKQRIKLEAKNSVVSAIRNNGTLNFSDSDLNKGLNTIWHDTLAGAGGNYRKAMAEYVQTVGRTGQLGSDFKGTVQRSLRTAWEGGNSGGLPPNDWVASIFLVNSMEGNVDMLGLSADELLAAKVAARVFDTHTSKDGTLAPVPEATQAAYLTYSNFRTKKAAGTLPDYIQDKSKFSKLVAEKLKDKTKLPAWNLWGTDPVVTADVVANVTETAYALAINNSYDNVDDLLDIAVSKAKNDYVVVNNRLQRQPKIPLHDIMKVQKDKIQEAEKEFINSAFIKEAFPGHTADDLIIDVVGIGADAAFVVASNKPDSNLPTQYVPASHVGNIYRETDYKRKAVIKAQTETDLTKKRKAAVQAQKDFVHDFTNSIGPTGDRSEMVPEKFKKIYFSSNPEMREVLATAWINAYDRAAMQDMRMTFARLRTAVLDPLFPDVNSNYGKGKNVSFMTSHQAALKAGAEAKEKHKAAVAQKRKELADLLATIDQPGSKAALRTLGKRMGMSDESIQRGSEDVLGMAEVKDMANILNESFMDDISPYIVSDLTTRALIAGTEKTMKEAEKSNKDKFKIPEAVHSSVNKIAPVGSGKYDHLRESKFLDSYSVIAVNEGKYGWDTNGAQVFMGINRKSWPNWSLWKTVDNVVKNNVVYRTTADKNTALDKMADDPIIRTKVAEFYHKNFYKPMQLDKIKDTSLRSTILDFAVRGGKDTYNKLMRTAIKDLGGNTSINTEPLTQGHIDFINKNSTAFFNVFFSTAETAAGSLNVPQTAKDQWAVRNSLLK